MGGMIKIACAAALLAAAAHVDAAPTFARVAGACTVRAASGGTLASQLDQARRQCGSLLLLSTQSGIEAVTPDLRLVVRLTQTQGRYLHLHRRGAARQLFFFAAERPDLLRLDLTTGKTTVVARVGRLKHRCFDPDGKTGVDPVKHIQQEQDLAIDASASTACFVARDRNVNMLSGEVTYRVDLRSGKVESRVTFLGAECGGQGKGEKAPCNPHDLQPASSAITPAGAPAPIARLTRLAEVSNEGLSASGRYAVLSASSLGDQGDYLYRPLFLVDVKDGRTFAITRRGLAAADLPRTHRSRRRPARICMIVGEDRVLWLPGTDVLVVDRCRGDGSDRTDDASPLLVIRPPGTVRRADASTVAIY
jgi:hypothetical protein